LFKAGNAEDMAKQILKIYQYPELREKIEKNALKSVKKYDWEIINKKLAQKIAEII
jgi:glycosyltransferase involved in cell wall biosynthesis